MPYRASNQMRQIEFEVNHDESLTRVQRLYYKHKIFLAQFQINTEDYGLFTNKTTWMIIIDIFPIYFLNHANKTYLIIIYRLEIQNNMHL